MRTPTTAACPEGITRAAVLELCRRGTASRREVGDLSLTEVYRADEVVLHRHDGRARPVLPSTAAPSATAPPAR